MYLFFLRTAKFSYIYEHWTRCFSDLTHKFEVGLEENPTKAQCICDLCSAQQNFNKQLTPQVLSTLKWQRGR